MALTFTNIEKTPDTTTALRWPVGAASPLWLAFAGAAAVGAAYFWMTRWTKPVNLEALTPLPVPSPIQTAPVEATPASVIEASPALPAIAAGDRAVATTASSAEAILPEAVAEAAEKVIEIASDDLTALVGVGPKLAASLAEHGVVRFEQIAHWGPDDIDAFDRLLNLRGRAVRDAWVAQAKRLAAEARA